MDKTYRIGAPNTNGLSRREMLRCVATAGTALAGVSALGMCACANGQTKKTITKGRLNQSIAYWCFSKYWDIEKTCRIARQLECKSIELVEPKAWPTLRK